MVHRATIDYKTKGFVHLEGVFDFGQCEAMRNEAMQFESYALKHFQADPAKFGMVSNSGTTELYRIDPIIDLSPLFRQIALQSSFKTLVDTVVGCTNLLLKDKLIYKKPGSRGFPLHQDYSWCHFPFPESLVTVAISLDPSTAENGMIECLPGCHTLLSAPDELRHLNTTEIETLDLTKIEPIPTQPGDIVIFSGFTPHRSAPNRAMEERRMIFYSYNDQVEGDFYDAFLTHNRRYTETTTAKDGSYVDSYNRS